MWSSYRGLSSSIRVVRTAAAVGSGEPEFASSGVAASYRLRTSREHNDAEMLVEKVITLAKVPNFQDLGTGSYRPADRRCENALECGLSLRRNPIRWDPGRIKDATQASLRVIHHSPERAVLEDER